MIVTINTEKVTGFIRRHKGAVVMGTLAVVVNYKQFRRISSMNNYLASKGLFDDYWYNRK